MRSAQVLACPQAGKTEVCPSSCWVSSNHLTALPNMSEVNAPAQLTPCHSVALNLGQHLRGKDSTLGCRGDPVLGQSQGRAAVVTAGVYSSSAPEAAQTSDNSTATGFPRDHHAVYSSPS